MSYTQEEKDTFYGGLRADTRQILEAKVGDKVTYFGCTWEVIDILPAGSRVLYRPWYKFRKTGVMIV